LDIPPNRHADVADSNPEFIKHLDHSCSLLYSSIALSSGRKQRITRGFMIGMPVSEMQFVSLFRYKGRAIDIPSPEIYGTLIVLLDSAFHYSKRLRIVNSTST
jgi:hypothetical protein